jgi:hypothetical protein
VSSTVWPIGFCISTTTDVGWPGRVHRLLLKRWQGHLRGRWNNLDGKREKEISFFDGTKVRGAEMLCYTSELASRPTMRFIRCCDPPWKSCSRSTRPPSSAMRGIDSAAGNRSSQTGDPLNLL